VVYHDASVASRADEMYASYVEYGRRMAAMMDGIRQELESEPASKDDG